MRVRGTGMHYEYEKACEEACDGWRWLGLGGIAVSVYTVMSVEKGSPGAGRETGWAIVHV